MGGLTSSGFMVDLASAVQIAFYVGMPGAMYYVGSVLSKLSTRLESLSSELERLSIRWEQHLRDHMSGQFDSERPK